MKLFFQRSFLPLAVLLACASLLVAQDAQNRHVRFGLPTPAKADSAQREDYLISRPQYSLSYNAKTRTPNWVSWCVAKTDIGTSQRGAFEPDLFLPKGFVRISTHVYDGSGFDRGHMCPAQDRSSGQKDMDSSDAESLCCVGRPPEGIRQLADAGVPLVRQTPQTRHFRARSC